MRKTIREYDYNIWSTGESLFLTAYELKEDISGQADWLILNPSRYQSIKWVIGDPKNRGIIEFLVSPDLVDEDLTDYDEWVTLSDLLVEQTPPEIKRWLDQLPEYEVANG